MRRYKPWQLALGYIIGLAVLIGGLALTIYAVVIVQGIWLIIFGLISWVLDWVWNLVF